MFRHNLLLILRNFRKDKGTFLINLAGLSSGLACTLLIYIWAADEMSMDKFHAKSDRLFRVLITSRMTDEPSTSTSTQAILGEALALDFPEIESVSTGIQAIELTLSLGSKHVSGNGMLAEQEFFNMFSFDLRNGDPNRMLADKTSIALSESMARALFGDAPSALNKSVSVTSPFLNREFRVSGVFADTSPRSSTKFDYVISFEVYKDLVGKESMHWGNYGCETFVLLKPNADVQALNVKLSGWLQKKAKEERISLFLDPYKDYYLHGEYTDGKRSGGRIEYVRLFSIIGVFIIVLACINFMNLSTARATRRMKEVGIKKVVGAGRRALIAQYLSESVAICFLSLLLAVLAADLLLPSFNTITGKDMTLQLDAGMIAILLGIVAATGLLAGSYPALYLSGFSPANILRSNKAITGTGKGFEVFARKGLIVFQFVISLMFIMAVWVVYKQIQFVQTTHLGYDKDHLIIFNSEGAVLDHRDTYLSEVSKLPGVANASSIGRTIVGAGMSTMGYFNWEGKDPNAQIRFEMINGGYDLIETLGIEVSEGRSFSREHATDSLGMMINEAGLRAMGISEPVGKKFRLWDKDYTIIGIAKDFHFESLRENVKPLFIRLVPAEATQIVVRLEAGREQEALKAIEAHAKRFNAGYDFTYAFLDKQYAAQYAAERRVGVLSGYFACLAIIISCLGLFGLATFTAERRLKEIGIRKVLGSGEWRIIWMLSVDFVKVVLIASAIALPLSYFLSAKWLDGFAFRIPLHWWYFPAAGLIAFLIAILTVSLQALRASRINPVQCLKEQ